MLLAHTCSSQFSLFTKDSRWLKCVLVSWLHYWWCAMWRKSSGSVLVEPLRLQLFERVGVMLSSIYFRIKLFNINCLQILNETSETPSNKQTFIQPLTPTDTRALQFSLFTQKMKVTCWNIYISFWRPLWWEKNNLNLWKCSLISILWAVFYLVQHSHRSGL